MTFIVAISGTHGSGKTTLATALAADLDARLVPEAARVIIDATGDDTFFHRNQNNLARQALLMVHQLGDELRTVQSGAETVVCDRSIVDHWAYTCALSSVMSEVERALFERIIFAQARLFDAVIVCEPLSELELDGVRECGRRFQEQIHQSIVEIYTRADVRLHVLTGPPAERLERAVAIVGANP